MRPVDEPVKRMELEELKAMQGDVLSAVTFRSQTCEALHFVTRSYPLFVSVEEELAAAAAEDAG